MCTGEIISPHVVLTAAHCVDPATVGTGAKTIVFIGSMLPATGAPPPDQLLAVKETHFDSSFDENHPENGHDVGVVILVNPTTITPVPYNRTPMPQTMVGQAARLVGYGITSGSDTSGATAGTRREAPTTLANLDSLFVGLQDGQHGICEGDSGGPSFMKFDGVERIVGVTSFGFQNCPLTPPAGTPPGFEAGNDTRIDTYADFIDMYVNMSDPPAKHPGDLCNSDADCIPLQCVQTSVGKICEQSCGPNGTGSCPAGTTCTAVDGSQHLRQRRADGRRRLGRRRRRRQGGGGCGVASAAPVGGGALALRRALMVVLRRRRGWKFRNVRSAGRPK